MRLSSFKLIFLGLAVLAFSVRSIYFSQTAGFISPGAGSDSYFYLQWARDILRGNFLGKDVFCALPLYPYFLSLAYLFSAGKVFDLILIQIFIGALNCGLIYLVGERVFGRAVGVVASIIACGYSMFIFYDRMLLPASLAIFLSLFLVLLLLKAKEAPNCKIWFVAGFVLGLAALTAASFSLLAILILFWMGYEYKKDESFKRILLYAASFLAAFSLLIGGVTLRNYLVANDKVFITAHSGINFYIGNNPQANGLFKPPPYMRSTQSGLIEDSRIIAEKLSAKRLKPSEVSNFWFRRSFYFIKRHPLSYLKLLGRKFVLFWNAQEHIDDMEYYIFAEKAGFLKMPLFRLSLVLPLGLLGMFLSWPLRKRAGLLYFFIFGPALAVISFFVNSRYRLLILPYLIIFAAFSLWQLLLLCRRRQYKRVIFSSVLFSALYFLTNIAAASASARNNFSFHYNKGVVLSEAKRYEEASREYQAALKLNSLDFMSYLGLGNACYETDNLSGAIDNYKRALAINPYFYDAHFNLGIVYNQMGQRQQAKEEFEKALSLKPDDCAAHYNLGTIYQEEGLKEAALKEYEAALEIEPEHPEVIQAIKEIGR